MLLVCASGIWAAAEDGEGFVSVDLGQSLASNIPKISDCLKNGRFVFRCPPRLELDQSFSVKFVFHVPASGEYIPGFKGRGPGSRGQSRFSYVIDGGVEQEVFARRVATPADGRGYGWQEQWPVILKKGDHVLELQFHSGQQVRLMNRVNEERDGHAVEIEGIRFAPVPATPPAATAKKNDHFLWKGGDTVVFFGDSITDEGLYLVQVTRLLKAAFPEEHVTCINSGISLNRTWEGVERIDHDVIALKPNWVVLAFGVNDAIHMSPDEFKTNYEKILQRLHRAKIEVICATPSGMLAGLGSGQKTCFHAPDRAAGFDRAMEYEAAAIQSLAEPLGIPVADWLGAFRNLGVGRAALMTDQWHPNAEGGRLMALSILRTVGFSEEDVTRSGDPRDLEVYRMLEEGKTPTYEVYAPHEFCSSTWPNGPVVAASSFSRNEVILADDAMGVEIARIPVGCHPMGLAYSPKLQTLYIACEGSGQLEALRLPECRLAKPITLGNVYPVAAVLSEDENTVWTGNFFGRSISEVDLNTAKVRRVIEVGGIVESLVYLPAQKRLLAATRAGLKLVDAEKGEVEKTLLLSDHHDAFLRGADGTLYAIDTVNWTQTALILPTLTAGTVEPCAWPTRASADRVGSPGCWVADLVNDGILRINDEGKTLMRVPGVDDCFGITIISQSQ